MVGDALKCGLLFGNSLKISLREGNLDDQDVIKLKSINTNQ